MFERSVMDAPPVLDCELAVSPYLDVLVCSADEVRIRYGTLSDQSLSLTDENRGGVVGVIFEHLLNGPITRSELLARTSSIAMAEAAVDALIDDLMKSDLVLPVEEIAGAQLPARFAWLAGKPDARVSVVGDGHATELLLDLLVEAGAEVDVARPAEVSDAFERASMSRDLGRSFVVVVQESFSPAQMHDANGCSIETGVPWIAAHCDGPLVVVGPLYTIGETCCYAEFETQILSAVSNRAEVQAHWDASETRTSPHRPPRWQSSHLATWLAPQVLEFAVSGSSRLAGRAYLIDVARQSVERVRALALPRCPVCRPSAGGAHAWD